MIATTKDIERIVAHSLSNPIHSISSSLHNAKDFNKVVAWLKQSVHSNWESDRPYSLQLAKILYYLLHENQSKETNKMISDSTLESIAAKLVNPEIFLM